MKRQPEIWLYSKYLATIVNDDDDGRGVSFENIKIINSKNLLQQKGGEGPSSFTMGAKLGDSIQN